MPLRAPEAPPPLARNPGGPYKVARNLAFSITSTISPACANKVSCWTHRVTEQSETHLALRREEPLQPALFLLASRRARRDRPIIRRRPTHRRRQPILVKLDRRSARLELLDSAVHPSRRPSRPVERHGRAGWPVAVRSSFLKRTDRHAVRLSRLAPVLGASDDRRIVRERVVRVLATGAEARCERLASLRLVRGRHVGCVPVGGDDGDGGRCSCSDGLAGFERGLLTEVSASRQANRTDTSAPRCPRYSASAASCPPCSASPSRPSRHSAQRSPYSQSHYLPAHTAPVHTPPTPLRPSSHRSPAAAGSSRSPCDRQDSPG